MAKRGSHGLTDSTSQLGSFLRTALGQLDTVGKVVVQKGRAGKLQLDLTLLRRKRKDALAALGETTARLAAEGRLRDDELSELVGPLADLEAIDERIEIEERRARAAAAGLPDDVVPPDFAGAARQADEFDDEEYDGGPADEPNDAKDDRRRGR